MSRLSAGSLILIVLCGATPQTERMPTELKLDPPDLSKLFGAEMLAVLDRPDRVESYRVTSEQEPSGAPKRLGGYPILNRGPDLTSDLTATMRQIVLDPNNHPPFMSSCMFEPGVALRYVKGEHDLIILLCFKCKDWRFIYPGRQVSGTFHGIEGRLAAVAKALFPKDAQIQSLP